ncbi:SCO family protein [Pseudobacillus wudalianchiensis]|uniref:Cytochrome c oxidase assembly protein n=1 Tax=Pseudobacillus wudalianchiensis TaxID=1743143 RepID=A0A1B9B6M1_9BACI|nr:SCO family protein [Bacillus wudalianchiensis]OCA91745.1 cytochrome c oxidase assembly protein [Bacillus wudalianchiensis]
MRKNPLLILGIILVILSACSLNETKPYQMKPFTFTNQNGKPFGSENLKGKVWIANFIFTNCDTVCPPMTANMAALQKRLKAEHLPVDLVSFSVDPAVDTPEKLKKYLANFTEDESNWQMLTGYTQEQIEAFGREAFQTLVQKPASSDQVIHNTNFYLVNQNGEIINEYSFTAGTHSDDIMKDVKKVLGN